MNNLILKSLTSVRSALLIGVLAIIVWPTPSLSAQTDVLSVDDLITLKELGFSEQQLRQELTPLKGNFSVSESQVKKLQAAGVSDEFLSFLATLAPEIVMDNAAVAKALQSGKSTIQILKEITKSKPNFDASASAMLKLNRQTPVPLAVSKAILGQPLTIEGIQSLLSSDSNESEIVILVNLLGVKTQVLQPKQALALKQAGLSVDAIRKVREAATKVQLTSTEPPKAIDPNTFDKFDHVTDLFSLPYPREWFFETNILSGSVVYFASPQRRVTDPAEVDTAIALGLEPLSKGNKISAIEAVNNYNALVREAIPGYQIEGTVREFEHKSLPAASQAFRAEIDGQLVSGRITAIVGRNYLYFLSTHAPADQRRQLDPIFDYVAAGFEVETRGTAARKNGRLSSQAVVSQFEEAIVQVQAWGQDANGRQTGTGFFVRKDGYLVTNAHVVIDLKSGRALPNLRVVWPDRMNRDPEVAELVDVENLFAGRADGLSVGNDMAVLRITSAKPLTTIPLTPVDEVSLGDEIVIVGYPLTGLFGGKLETTVTSGVVTRFQRREDDTVHTIVSDAIASGGNSGGPVISLRTGGVIGLLSQGSQWHLKEKKAARYSGILPSDTLMRYFPEQTMVSAKRSQTMTFVDSYDLALRSFEGGSVAGAKDVITRAIQRRPQDANGYSLQGQILMSTASLDGNSKPALDSFKRALDIDRDHVPTLLARSGLEMMRGDAIAALRFIDRALAAEPKSWLIHYQRARINIVLERFDSALSDLITAQKASGGLIPQPFSLAGHAQYAKEEFEKGKALYEQAVAISGLDVESRLGIGQYYIHKGQYSNALIEFDKLNTEVPRNPLVLAYTGQTYYLQSNFPRAKQHLWDSYVRYNKLSSVTQEEPPAFLYQALADAARKDRDSLRATIAYTRLLARYSKQTGAEQSVTAHEYLAAQAKEKHPEVQRMHLVFASRIAREENADLRKRVATPLDKLKRGRLSLNNILFMDVQRRYAPEMTAAIIRDQESRLDFSVPGGGDRNGKPDKARRDWLNDVVGKKGMSIPVVRAILKKSVSRQAKSKSQKPAQSNRTSLLGEWIGQKRDDGALVFQFAQQGQRKFQLFATSGNRRELLDEGSWMISKDGFTLTLNGQQGAFSIPISSQRHQGKDALLLTMGGQQERYVRIK